MKHRNKSLAFFLIILSIAYSCGEKRNKQDKVERKFDSYGTLISDKNIVSSEDVYSLMSTSDTLETKLMGEIIKTCPKKGCWMTVKTNNGQEVRITFKDYGFFVPKNDVEGKKVIFQGQAIIATTPIAALRHFAEDAGASKEELSKITEPRRELKFIAQGVLIEN